MTNLLKYTNGNYNVTLSLKDGTKIRETEEDEFIPSRPESIDIKITNKCDIGCPFCHENSIAEGQHADLDASWINTIPYGTEIAVGGGNALCHPDLVPFLIKLRGLGCVPSITVNQKHFIESYSFIRFLQCCHLVYGVGVSITGMPTEELIAKLKETPNVVCHVIAGVITEKQLDTLSDNGLNLLILGYKDIRRGSSYKRSHNVNKNIDMLKNNLPRYIKDHSFSKIAFDNLALEQIEWQNFVSENEYKNKYMGNEGSFTFYIDAVNKEYAVSSSMPGTRKQIMSKTITEMFKDVRNLNEKN